MTNASRRCVHAIVCVLASFGCGDSAGDVADSTDAAGAAAGKTPGQLDGGVGAADAGGPLARSDSGDEESGVADAGSAEGGPPDAYAGGDAAPDGPSGTLLTASDCLLDTGTPGKVTYTAPGSGGTALITAKSNPGAELWVLSPDPWGITTGSGSITMAYSGQGAITTTVALSDLNPTAVSAYPFIGYGADPWGFHHDGQPPRFPAKLSSMSALVFETSYALTGTFPAHIDVLFDEWLIPSASYAGGDTGAVEVEILPFWDFAAATWGTFQKSFTVPMTVNGTVTTRSFDEYLAHDGGRSVVLFYPTPLPGLSTAALRFDALTFLAEAATTSGVGLDWYVAGMELGPEFGQGAAANMTFTVSKLCVEQTLRP